MSRRTRRHRESPFSLFSFQDIIAAVTGVVLLITLLLILELILRRPGTAEASAAPAVDTEALAARVERAREQLLSLSTALTAAELDEANASLDAMRELLVVLDGQQAAAGDQAREVEARVRAEQAELDALAAEAADLRRRAELERARTRVTLLEGDRGGMTTWFLECDAGEVRAGRIDDEGAATVHHRFTSADEAARWAMTQPRERERFVLLVRPGGVDVFDTLQASLRADGYSIGWDLWTSDAPLFVAPPDEGGSHAP